MNLKIKGHSKEFNVESIHITEAGIGITSESLIAFIVELETEALKAEPEAAPTPPAPAKVEYVANPENRYTLDQYKASNWTEEQMIAGNILIEKKIDAPAAPEPDMSKVNEEVFRTGEFRVEGAMYKMTAKAAGATYEQFQASNWKLDKLIEEGYAEALDVTPKVPAAPTPPVEDKWPRMNDEGDWEDSAGTVFVAGQHSMGSDKVPAVTVKGVFKKSRAKNKTPKVPAAPSPSSNGVPAAPSAKPSSLNVPEAPSASGVPAAPGAATIDVVPETSTITDEPLDDELANLIKDWK